MRHSLSSSPMLRARPFLTALPQEPSSKMIPRAVAGAAGMGIAEIPQGLWSVIHDGISNRMTITIITMNFHRA